MFIPLRMGNQLGKLIWICNLFTVGGKFWSELPNCLYGRREFVMS